MGKNDLSNEVSPYLLQHKDNPIHWYAWGDAAFKKAETEDKPILLSVGYSACHWCHVMARESFENKAIADYVNENYVAIKVDREERPDVDALYQSALTLYGEQGGWPLTMFLTPKKLPFWGGTYFPDEAKFGKMSFGDVLKRIHIIYSTDPEKVEQNTGYIRKALQDMSLYSTAKHASSFDVKQAADALLQRMDWDNGGLQGAPKFPQFPILRLFMRFAGDPHFFEIIQLSLNKICQGGIYDHLGGGLSRYTIDEHWLIPHFEKMLYDNAQFIEALTEAWMKTRSPLYAKRIEETVAWLLQDMQHKDGGFYCAFNAESEGVEGKYYVWSETEIDAVLGERSAEFKDAYGVSEAGNWEATNILNTRSMSHYEGLKPQREQLLAVRKKRIAPSRDEKILADWNGLIITALAKAGFVFERPEWIEAAKKAYDFVKRNLRADGQLAHAWCQGRAQSSGLLDDYIAMIRAAIALYEVLGDEKYLADAIAWEAEVSELFYDDKAGGYFMSPTTADDLIIRTKAVYDQAVPNGNGMAVEVLARLYYHTGTTSYLTRAEAVVNAFAGELSPGMTTLVGNIGYLQEPTQVVIVGKRNNPDTKAFLSHAYRTYLPYKIISVVEDTSKLAEQHPAYGKLGKNDGAIAYICRGRTCSAPIDQMDVFKEVL